MKTKNKEVVLEVSKEEINVNEDPWNVPGVFQDDEKKWSELTQKEKLLHGLAVVGKAIGIPLCLYVFVCSLSLMSDSFRLIAGKAAGSVFQNVEVLQNPVVGVMIGILVTVLVQSSSTSTTIIVSLVAAQVLKIDKAIPMVMGSNVGTSITNTIVSFTQVGDRNVFRRAFAAATIHDMFNWLAVLTLLPLEVTTGYLQHLTHAIVESFDFKTDGVHEIKLLNALTDPLIKRIIQLDKNVLKAWSIRNTNVTDEALLELINSTTLLKKVCTFKNGTHTYKAPCDYLFANIGFSDLYAGLILLAVSLLCLCGCLLIIVKILNSVLKGKMAKIIRKTINADIKYVPWLSGYLAMFVGCALTILVQSSSIFTSALTPLAGLGVITLERIYPMTLGSNVGTTTTAILASLAATGESLKLTIQISLCHLFFNLTGILLFYIIPFMRFPIPLAKLMGNVTAKYRWFAIVYVIFMFFIFPALVFALSLAGSVVFMCIMIPIFILIIFITIINILQHRFPYLLPSTLRDWNFLPIWLRSLEPYDQCFNKCVCCTAKLPPADSTINSQGADNLAYQKEETKF